jgi:hypothetical protein
VKGWTEEEIKNKDLMAPCGLYCGACGIYIATRDENEKFKGVMGRLYGTEPEETECCGCMQSDPPEKALRVLQNMPHQRLRKREGVLFMPSM